MKRVVVSPEVLAIVPPHVRPEGYPSHMPLICEDAPIPGHPDVIRVTAYRADGTVDTMWFYVGDELPVPAPVPAQSKRRLRSRTALGRAIT